MHWAVAAGLAGVLSIGMTWVAGIYLRWRAALASRLPEDQASAAYRREMALRLGPCKFPAWWQFPFSDASPLELTPKGNRLWLAFKEGETDENATPEINAMSQLLIIIHERYAETFDEIQAMLVEDARSGECAVIHYRMLPVLRPLCAWAHRLGLIRVAPLAAPADAEEAPVGPVDE